MNRILIDLYCSKTVQGTFVSMGVYSDGSYKVPAGLIYSFPVTCEKGEWHIVQGIVQVDQGGLFGEYCT
jgi:malate/lactate dehydrogenase